MESDDAPATKGKVIVDTNAEIDGTAVVKGESEDDSAGNEQASSRAIRRRQSTVST